MAMRVNGVSRKLLLGVDGGGSKTEAVIAAKEPDRDDLSEIARVQVGPGNLLTSAQAKQNVAEAIESVLQLACQSLDYKPRIDSACLSLAGTGRPQIMGEWRRWVASQHIASAAFITDDVAPVLRHGGASGPAVAIIAGTGSIAVGLREDGSRVRCGGWGHMIGDEGSGYDIACRALRAASFHEDGRARNPRLHQAALEHFGVREFTDVIPKIQSATREEVSQFTKMIAEVDAKVADRDIHRIFDQAALSLAKMIATVERQIRSDNRAMQIAFAGGVLCHVQHVRDALLNELSRQKIMCVPRVVDDPAWGTVLLAADS